ncbi:MAG: NADH-quinone oxidoreductase subunit NuoH [Planctomycetota bacterium]|nr:NADH-quinone oxidoreductase subunit NuoH [Planctomycetota bacterium]
MSLATIEPASRYIADFMAGLVGLETSWPFHAVAMLVVATFVVLIIVTPVGLGGVYLERKIAGRMQNRRGPNRVGPFGLLQAIADGVKLLAKEDIVKRGMDEPLFRFAPYVVFLAAFTGMAIIPYAPLPPTADGQAQALVAAPLNVGIFFLLSMIGLETIGIVMAGWSSNNKWSLLGSMREVAQVISYELPLGIAAMCPVLAAGTLNIVEMTNWQEGSIFSWFLIKDGYYGLVGIPSFLIFYVSALAAAKRAPFDLPEAESELVAGFHTEYSGMRFGLFFLPEYVLMLTLSAVMTAMWLGGYHDPFGLSAGPDGTFYGAWLWGLLWFAAKTALLFLSMIALRWTLPRLRIDQVMYLCYKVLLPLSLFLLLLTAALRLL